MQLIQTPFFELACYIDGNFDADKLFLCLPGFLDTGNYVHLKAHRAYFAERGFLCVSFDPLGTFKSSGNVSLYSVTNYLQAIDEIIAYFGNKETIILGHSLGGSIAMLASERNPHIEKSIAIMSPYCFKNHFKQSRYLKWNEDNIKGGIRDIPDSDTKREYAIPYSFVEDAMHYDLEQCIQALNKPKLFIAGLQDDIIDPETVKTGYEIASEPKEYREIDAGHNYRFDEEKIGELNEIVEKILGL